MPHTIAPARTGLQYVAPRSGYRDRASRVATSLMASLAFLSSLSCRTESQVSTPELCRSEARVRSVTDSELTAIGLSVAGILDNLQAHQNIASTWATEASSKWTTSIPYGVPVTVTQTFHRTDVPAKEMVATSEFCQSTVEIELLSDVQTSDGLLAETRVLTFVFQRDRQGSAASMVSPSELGGTLDASSYNGNPVTVKMEFRVGEQTVNGGITAFFEDAPRADGARALAAFPLLGW